MTARATPPAPDPDRVGGPAWMARTAGQLTCGECLRGVATAARQQVGNQLARRLPFLVRRLDVRALPGVPDSRLVRRAEEAVLDQGAILAPHGFRTSMFGRALAHGDGVAVDRELLHVCGLLHDAGLVTAVTGEDFTIRSAAVVRQVAADAGEAPAIGAALADAVMVHTTIGVTPARDGALGTYTQAGAMVDLVGLRLRALPRDFVRQVLTDYPRGAFKRELLRRFAAEAAAVPRGRFGLARRVGFAAAVRAAPFPT